MPATGDAVKVVVLGRLNVGKTALLARFSSDEFTEIFSGRVSGTVAGGFFAKSIMVGTDKVTLHMWDTAGSEQFNSISRLYYRNAQAGILCYDITDYRSFDDVQFWAQELARNEPNCRIYLCGCKLDLQNDMRQVTLAQAKNFADAKGAAAVFETSARTGENVPALFNRICLDAVNWTFVSITTGKVTSLQNDQNSTAAPDSKSFRLTGRNDRRSATAGTRGSGCASHKCLI